MRLHSLCVYRVERPQTVLSQLEKTGVVESSQVAGSSGLRDIQRLHHLADAALMFQKQVQYPEPGLIGQCLDCFDQVSHFALYAYMRIYAYSLERISKFVNLSSEGFFK